MKKRKILYTSVLVIIIVGCIWAFIASSFITANFKKEVFDGPPDKQEANVKNLIVVETKDDTKFWEFYAESGHYDSISEAAILENIFGNFYTKNNDVIISFRSSKGNFSEKTKTITLTGDTIIMYKDGTSITAKTFEWEGKDDIISANGDVKIFKLGEFYLTGDKAILQNNKTEFKLSGHTVTRIYKNGK